MLMSKSNGNALLTGALVGAFIGLTFGAFVRLFRMAVGIPQTALMLYSDRRQRLHFMYYPAAALTLVALVMVFYAGTSGHIAMIAYGLFIGWIAGDLKYYSDKWHGRDGLLSWCPGLGCKRGGQYARGQHETLFSIVFAGVTFALSVWCVSPVWRLA
jgi:hypothetical protein